ncbi:MAG: hypothetical protein JWR12_1923 [Mucilaginibacter sp.]|nr:hypothetical protein [Mucilaginibacter sp.]
MENLRDKDTVKADENLAKGKQPTVQNKSDEKRVPTVTPDNDSGTPGESAEKPSAAKQTPADKKE